MIDKVFVHKARMRMGEYLAQKIQRELPNHNIDVVIPVPDTSRTSALEIAIGLGVKYREGFIKNRYIGRTFIMPWQNQRDQSVRRKLHPLNIEFKDKNILIVDDSIVRGTTSKQIIQLARDAGARKVYFASAAPPVRHPNVYGIDMPTKEELISHNRTDAEIAQSIDADHIFFQDLPDLVKSITVGNPDIASLECSVFNGEYRHEIEPEYFDNLKRNRHTDAHLDSNPQQQRLNV